MDINKQPFVSFCISTYRRPELLKSTLQTIARQTFTDFEVIISDNGPDAASGEVVKNMNDSRFKYFHNEENLGMIRSFNKSIERSSAGYIVMITDDDPVYPDMLGTLVRLEKEYPGYGLYMGGCDWFCKAPEVAKLYQLKVGTNSCLSGEYELDHVMPFAPDEFLKLFFTFKLFPHYLWSTCMVRRDVLLKAGGVPDYGTPFLGDYAYLAVMSAASGCVVINKSLGCQTLHKENFGRDQNEQILTAAKEFPRFVEQHLSGVKDWALIKKQLLHFTALWLVSHLSFLYSHKKTKSLEAIASQVFNIDYVKPYRSKYFLKTKFPFVHNNIVKIKKRLKG